MATHQRRGSKGPEKRERQGAEAHPVSTGPLHSPDVALPSLLQRAARQPRHMTPGGVQMLQRAYGNRIVTNLIPRSPSLSPNVIQRNGDDLPVEPYQPTTPPAFEYWVNSMWKEVEDEGTKGTVLGLLKGSNKDPRPGDQIDVKTKKEVMKHLYDKAYEKRDWVSAEELIKEGSLAHEVNVTGLVSRGRQVGGKKKIAVGFHGTARDPDTVLKVHGGTKPTIERHGKPAGDKAGIQKYLKEKLGIEEWHPFWFGGDIEKRPFLFRNVQADNELDTTISVAKAAQDSIDFPMIESMPESEKSEADAHGFPITTTYVYAVGVTEGYGTTEREQKPLGKAFGQGEIATKHLDPDDHLGYVKYERIHAGPSRNLGYKFRETFSDVLPGGRKLRVTDQVKGILGAMPKAGMYHVHDAEVFDANKIYSGLKESGKKAAESANRLASKTNPPAYLKSAVVAAKKKVGGTDEDWKTIAIAKEETIKHAPSEKAKAKRLEAYLEGVREVLPTSGI